MLFIGIVMVVMGHNYVPSDFIFYKPYTFHIPLFFFISGYFFKVRTTLKDKKKWILYKVKNQLLLYFIYNLVFSLIDLLTGYFFLNTVREDFLFSFFVRPFIDGHQYGLFIPGWFLIQLFLANVVLQLLIWKSTTALNWFYFLFSLFLSLYSMTLGLEGLQGFDLILVRTSMAIFYMMLGRMFSLYESIIIPYIVRFPFVILMFLTINILGTYGGNTEFSMVWGNVHNNYVWVPLLSSSLILIMVYILAYYIKDYIKDDSFILKIGQNSFHIMIWHLTIFTIIKGILVILGMAYWGDLLGIYNAPNASNIWFIYQIGGLVIPVIIIENIKKISTYKLFTFSTSKLASFIILILFTFFITSCTTKNTLEKNETLFIYDYLISSNRMYKLVLQEDGNLVIYDIKGEVVWGSNTANGLIKKCIFQEDANLVLYDNNNVPYWASHTISDKQSRVILEDDGKLTIYLEEKAIWSNGQLLKE